MGKEALQWHPAFCSSLQIELKGEPLEFRNEYNLTRKPLQIDVLVIKKISTRKIQKNIGRLFRTHNIVEYKSPEDKLSINDYYKVLGYACIYQANTERILEIRPDEITLSFVANHFPKKMINWLKWFHGCKVEQMYPGIYYLSGLTFPVQVIVIKELSKAEHKWLSRLRTGLKVNEDLDVLADEYRKNQSNPLYATCMDVIVRANEKSYEKEGKAMCEAIREMMFKYYGDQLEVDRAKMRQELEVEVRQEVAKEVRQEVAEEVRQEVAKEVRQEVAEEVRQEVAEEVRQEVAEEVRQKVAKEVRQEVAKEVRQEVQEEIRIQTLIDQILKKLKKDKGSDQIADELELEPSLVLQICQVIDLISLESCNLDIFVKWKEMFAA